MILKAVQWSLTVGTCAALFVSVVMTAVNWRINPSGLFHGEGGTSWGIVLETVVSWFLPAIPILTLLVLPMALMAARRATKVRGTV